MKTVKEIKDKLEEFKKTRDGAAIFTRSFSSVSGAVMALEWVLEDSEDDTTNNKQTNN